MNLKYTLCYRKDSFKEYSKIISSNEIISIDCHVVDIALFVYINGASSGPSPRVYDQSQQMEVIMYHRLLCTSAGESFQPQVGQLDV